MNKTILTSGILLGILGIILGAFGTHGLEKIVNANAVASFETGVRYQIYHALFLLFLGSWEGLGNKQKKLVFITIILGVLLFSFSIYLLALNGLTTFDFKQIAFVTPVGGTFLIFGWFLAGYYILTGKSVK
ncbi:UPF0382 membrane protein [Flagellimonas maritima]|uniref:UPF0382 membrane protein n=1 Tax=Flagellimonas maritima TaxID=1383885 RepID=A0A2Z4LQP3_9FLAO|nr:DUF423 domain-containing protein [Allomuricauda aurantiaca]AWX44113.1 UPF0382 membrane protein [Allomuricauda aurantiaca]